MPLPLILLGPAIAAGIAGLGATAKAALDSSKAKSIGEAADLAYQKASERLEGTRGRVNDHLAALGQKRLDVSARTLKRVVAVADRVHVGKDQMKAAAVRGVSTTPDTVEEMKRASLTAMDLLGTGASALGTGALAGVGAFGFAMAFGTASTGTAITSLSGAAATNAAWAWLGGGAISAGGAGIAGGMMAVSGIVAGPVLAVIGIRSAIAAAKSLTDATEYAAKVAVAVEKIETAIAALDAVCTRADEVRHAVGTLEQRLLPILNDTEVMLDTKGPAKVPFNDLAVHEQGLYRMTVVMGTSLYQLIEVDVIDELGTASTISATVLDDTNRKLAEVEAGGGA